MTCTKYEGGTTGHPFAITVFWFDDRSKLVPTRAFVAVGQAQGRSI